MSYFAIFFGGFSKSSKKWDNMYKILFRFVPLHLKTDRIGFIKSVDIDRHSEQKIREVPWFSVAMPEKNDLADVTGRKCRCLLRPQKDPPNGNQRWMNIVHPPGDFVDREVRVFFFQRFTP